MYDVMSLFTKYLQFTTINNDIYLGAIKQGRHLLIKEQLKQSTIRSSWHFKNRSKTLLFSEYDIVQKYYKVSDIILMYVSKIDVRNSY